VTDELVEERRGPVLVARLNRPEVRNALNGTLIRAIGAAVNEAEADPEIRVLLITGTGDRAFCAGMDLKAFAEGAVMDLEDDEDGRAFYRFIEGRVAVPVVGAANATALAGGFELLLACDVVVASAEAVFGLPEVKRGLFPAGGGTFLGTKVALGVALELTLTGDPIGAQRAYDLGLVNAVVPPEKVMETAAAFADRIAANGPLAVAATKELVRLGATDTERAWERVRELRVTVFGSEDAKEGALAFVEKRSPRWRGR
jgi:enoyl-CoA hydratase